MRELPRVGGDARRVGYYTGIIVRPTFSTYTDKAQTVPYCIIGLTSLRGRGCHLIPVESPVRSHRPKACPFGLPCGHDSFNPTVWLVALLLGACLKVLLYLCSFSGAMSADRHHSRCLHGAAKGHIGAVKSMIAELTDETNIARGFSIPPVAWSLGFVIGFVDLSWLLPKFRLTCSIRSAP